MKEKGKGQNEVGEERGEERRKGEERRGQDRGEVRTGVGNLWLF